jgi:hypothetical protein
MFIIIWHEYAEIKYFSENLNKKYREKRLLINEAISLSVNFSYTKNLTD